MWEMDFSTKTTEQLPSGLRQRLMTKYGLSKYHIPSNKELINLPLEFLGFVPLSKSF